MLSIPMDKLEKFIVCAKSATYVGNGAHSLARRPGSHDLEFREPPFAYLDSYFGGADFIGEEVVYYEDRPVWAMNYYGRILVPESITPEEAGKVIKESLSLMYQEERFLGDFEHNTTYGIYHDANQGDIASFTGREWIMRDNIMAYELHYHGGLIK